ERELQKLGKTTVKMDSLANDLGFAKADDLYLAIAKDEFSLRHLQNYFEEAAPEVNTQEPLSVVNASVTSSHKGHNGVLIAGVDSLMTQLAKCCHPAPPDEVLGFITRGKGVSVHRRDCASLAMLQLKYPERLIEASWHEGVDQLYQVSLLMIAVERPNRLKDVSELLSRMKINVSGMNLLLKQGNVHIHLTLDVHSVEEVKQVMSALNNMSDVLSVKRV
nr:GTP pyrophosphokinase [Alcaligenaceae bacterium]MDB1145316.1 GTP pyrophosphokinase [Alcaligenaceae bacterium]